MPMVSEFAGVALALRHGCGPSAPGVEVLLAGLEVRAQLRGLEHCRPAELERGEAQRVEESRPVPLHLDRCCNTLRLGIQILLRLLNKIVERNHPFC